MTLKQRDEFEDVEEYIAYLNMQIQLNAAQNERRAQADIERSWRENPDRMGGQFTDEELNRPDRL